MSTANDIMKIMGKRSFASVAAKRPAAALTSSPAPKKPAAPTNGLSQGQQAPPPTESTQPDPQPAQEPPQPTPRREPRIPPFFVETSTEWPDLARTLSDMVDGDFTALARGSKFRITTSTPENFRKIQRHLLMAKVPFHTFTYGGGRSLKVVISGLPSYIGQNDLLDALEEKGLCVEDAARLRSRHGVSNRWLVTFVRDCEKEEDQRPAAFIWRVRELLHVKVTMSLYRRPPGPPQCYRCQRFGHGTSNCGYPLRCVRCGGPHAALRCESAAKSCCNCKATDHQANYRGCPEFARARAPMKPRPPQRPEPAPPRRPKPAAKKPPAETEPETPEDITSAEEEGFATARKRRKRPPRKRATRPARATKRTRTAEPAPEPRPGPSQQAPATPKPAPEATVEKSAQPEPQAPATEQPTVQAAITGEEGRQILQAISDLTLLVKELLSLTGKLLSVLVG